MLYAYMRVSTPHQTIENQHYELLKFADQRALRIDAWITETVSGARTYTDRILGQLVDQLTAHDTLLVSELSRLGRSVLEIMRILHCLMDKQVTVLSVKEGLEFGDTLHAKVLAFAFGLAAEIERALIATRTKEALARKKQEGQKLGRPQGSLSKKTKLTGQETEIKRLLEKRVAVSAIARLMGVHRLTMAHYIKSRRLAVGEDGTIPR
jgi:putative DNA-invertase from lambdoid prophage Rac